MSQISVNNLTFYYEGSYDNIFEDVSFQIDTDWKLGFIARNGRGKTTFLKLLTGQYEYRGSIASSVVFDYFPFEVRDRERNTIDVIEEIYPDYEFWKLCREFNYLAMDAEILYRPFSTLSNGEQTRVLLALLFTRENHFLLIDEPTNHLDMEAITSLNNGMIKFPGVMIFSSRDHQIVQTTANRIMEIINGRLVDKITTYDEYLESDEMARKRFTFTIAESDAADN